MQDEKRRENAPVGGGVRIELSSWSMGITDLGARGLPVLMELARACPGLTSRRAIVHAPTIPMARPADSGT